MRNLTIDFGTPPTITYVALDMEAIHDHVMRDPVARAIRADLLTSLYASPNFCYRARGDHRRRSVMRRKIRKLYRGGIFRTN